MESEAAHHPGFRWAEDTQKKEHVVDKEHGVSAPVEGSALIVQVPGDFL
jgi:hypothetical protein